LYSNLDHETRNYVVDEPTHHHGNFTFPINDTCSKSICHAMSKEDCLIILKRFGYSGKNAEACAEEWVDKFNVSFGLVKYYETYFNR